MSHGNLEQQEVSRPARFFKAERNGDQWQVAEYRNDGSKPGPALPLPTRFYAENVAMRLNETWSGALQHARVKV
jgi:hypothetical protein